MNITEIFQSFATPEQATEYLEKVRWNGKPVCPYCGSLNCGRHASGDRKKMRWQCHDCSRAFSVTVGTLFHGTHIPLKDWFFVLALVLNTQKSLSAYQVARDLGMRRPTVWSMMQRIRTAVANDPAQEKLLYGIVQADIATPGGEPRKNNKPDNSMSNELEANTKEPHATGVAKRNERVVTVVDGPINLSIDGASLQQATAEYVHRNFASAHVLHGVMNRAHAYANDFVRNLQIVGTGLKRNTTIFAASLLIFVVAA